MLNRNVFGLGRGSGSSAFQRKNQLAHFDLFAFFNFDFFDHAAHRRGNFHDSFVRLQLHHRLAFGNFDARSNHQSNQVTLVDILSKFGKRKFRWPRSSFRRRSRSCSWRRGFRLGFSRCRSSRCGLPLSFSLSRSGLSPGPILHRKNNLADVDLLAFLDPNIFDCAAH